jgi:hypothetical protein
MGILLKNKIQMNKLDSFNEDKIKCQDCKEYFDRSEIYSHVCLDCLMNRRYQLLKKQLLKKEKLTMSNLLVNIRIGCYHFQIEKDTWKVRFSKNQYWIENKPIPYFQIITFFNRDHIDYWLPD